MPEESNTGVDWEGGFWKTLCLAEGLFTMQHELGNPVLAVR